jgi:hypothetical protein
MFIFYLTSCDTTLIPTSVDKIKFVQNVLRTQTHTHNQRHHVPVGIALGYELDDQNSWGSIPDGG